MTNSVFMYALHLLFKAILFDWTSCRNWDKQDDIYNWKVAFVLNIIKYMHRDQMLCTRHWLHECYGYFLCNIWYFVNSPADLTTLYAEVSRPNLNGGAKARNIDYVALDIQQPDDRNGWVLICQIWLFKWILQYLYFALWLLKPVMTT